MLPITVGSFKIGPGLPLALIAGPCQIENRDHALYNAEALVKASQKAGVNFIYKSSFDKANRTSAKSARGVGIDKGLRILECVKQEFNCPTLTDIHLPEQCNIVSDVVDILQIPAFLCRQTDLLIEAGKSNLPVNVKKGQFLSPWDMQNVVKKLLSTGNKKILLTERGTTFGYNNLVSDIRSLVIMKETKFPIIFDATHSVQLPGGKGNSSGGQSKFVSVLAKAAVTSAISGIFMETHDNPSKAPSDGPNMVPLKKLGKLIHSIKLYDNLSKNELI